jgi:hypothetical protein
MFEKELRECSGKLETKRKRTMGHKIAEQKGTGKVEAVR